MASKKSISATLVLKDGGFKANIKSAIEQINNFKENTEGATSKLKNFDSQSSATGQSLGSLAKKVAGAVTAYVGFNQVKDFMTDCVTGVMELERANTRLETLMMNVSGTTKAQVDDLIEYGDALELCTTIEGDATMAGASQLATFQLSADTIKTLLPAFQDLAVAQYGVNVSQEQMINSGNLIGKVMNGSTGALTKAGVSFTAAQEQILKTGTESEKAAALVEVLGKNFGGLAQQMAQTDEGRIRQLKNAWGSVKDEVGFAVLPAVSSLVQFMSANIPQIRDTVTNVISRISTTFGTAWENAKEIFTSIKDAVSENSDKFENLKESIGRVGERLKSAFSDGTPVMTFIKDTAIPGIVDGLGNAVQAISWLTDNWDALSPVIYGVVGAIAAYNIVTGIRNGLTAIAVATTGLEAGAFSGLTIAHLTTAAAAGVLTAAQIALGAAMAFVKSPITLIALAIGGLIAIGVLLYKNWDTISKFFINMWNSIKEKATACWTLVKTGATVCWNAVKAIVSSFWNSIKNGASNCWNTIKNGATALWDGIKGVFSTIGAWLNTNIVQPFSSVATAIGTFFTTVWAGIVSAATSVFSWFVGILQNAWQSLVNIFTPVASFFGSIFTGAWNMVVSAFSNVVSFFQGIWGKIKSIFSTIGTAVADGISGAFKNVINSVIQFAGNLINKFIGGINWAIDKINNIIPGVTIGKLETVNLPMLAKGGNITRAGNVIVGERGPEMLSLPRGASVTPLGKAGTTNNNKFNITIYAENKSVGQIVDELIPQLKLALSNM